MTDTNSKRRIAAAVILGVASLLAQGQSGLSRPFNRQSRRGRVSVSRTGHACPPASPARSRCTFASRRGCTSTPTRPGKTISSPPPSRFPRARACGWRRPVYPAGTDFTLPLDPKTKLSVYTGEFTIQARIVAAAGDHLVEAKLRYQACDNNACMPPKTITVPIDVIGK